MDPKQRFTDRVGPYAKARPGYPTGIIDVLRNHCGLTNTSIVADVGSGTGILARMLCDYAHTVYGIEPNSAMRNASQKTLADKRNFLAVDGAAENTGLPATSVDLIIAAQAFHWFDQKEARHEFMRILKPNGFSALIWNDRRMSGSGFAEAYEQLLVEFGTDYKDVRSRGAETVEVLERFFGHSQIKRASVPNAQHLDCDTFLARITSSSYMPQESHPKYAAMLEKALAIFKEYENDGQIVMEYDTNIYYAQMS